MATSYTNDALRHALRHHLSLPLLK